MDISIVIPVYRSAQSLKPLVDEVELYFRVSQPDKRYELILVDDQSGDDTAEVLKELEGRERVRVFFPQEKLGQQKALYFGLLQARGELAVTMDDDLQHDIVALDAMLHEIRKGADLVYGIYRNHGAGLVRGLGSRLVSRFFRRRFPVVGQGSVSSFRCIRRSVYARLVTPLPGGFVYLSAELLPFASRVANVPVERRRRRYGKSGYSLWSGIHLAWKLYRHYGNRSAKGGR